MAKSGKGHSETTGKRDARLPKKTVNNVTGSSDLKKGGTGKGSKKAGY